LPTAHAACLEQGVGHGATDEDVVDLAEQVRDQLDLVADLGAAKDRHERALGRRHGFVQVADFLLDQVAGDGGAALGLDGLGHAEHAAVLAVAGAEGVVDVGVAQLGQAGHELVVLGLLLGGELLVGILLGLVGHGLAGVEADVLEQHDVARLHACHQRLGRRADDLVGAELTFLPSSSPRRSAHGLRLPSGS
jgi:hypothetical protein